MKILLLITALFGLCETNNAAALLSQTTNGVYVAIGGISQLHGLSTNGPIRFDDKLCFMAFCDTTNLDLAWPSDLKYGCKARMWDMNGREISKTSQRSDVGSKFDQLRDVYETRCRTMFAWGSFTNNVGLGGAVILPRPNELFEIKEPGIYRMEIVFQMCRRDQTNHAPFQFSPSG